MPASVLAPLSTCTPPPSPAAEENDGEADSYSQSFEDSVEESPRPDLNRSVSVPDTLQASSDDDEQQVGEGAVVRRRTGSTAIKRRAGGRRSRTAKLRRRFVNYNLMY